MIEEINAWIVSNQALVISVGIPCLTLLVTCLVSNAQSSREEKRASENRLLERDVQLASMMNERNAQLREAFSNFITLAGQQEDSMEAIAAMNRVLMFVSDQEKSKELQSIMLESITGSEDERAKELSLILSESQAFLRVRWDHVKEILESSK